MIRYRVEKSVADVKPNVAESPYSALRFLYQYPFSSTNLAAAFSLNRNFIEYILGSGGATKNSVDSFGQCCWYDEGREGGLNGRFGITANHGCSDIKDH